MTLKCFCDSCGKEVKNPRKNVSILIHGIQHFPDLCETCIQKVIDIAYYDSEDYYHDDKK